MRRKVYVLVILICIVLSITYYLYQQYRVKEEGFKIGVEFNTHATPIWIALEKKFFQKHGIIVSNVFKFRTGSELAAAITRGEVDIGFACLGPIVNIIDRGVDLIIISSIHQYGYSLIVNPNKINNIEDLVDKTVYVPEPASPANLLLIRIKEKYGLNIRSRVLGDPKAILTLLINGEIDAAVLPEHQVSIGVEHGLKILVDSRDVWRNMPGSFVVIRRSILEKYPWIVEKLRSIIGEAINVIKDEFGEAVSIDQKYLGIDKEVASESIKRLEWNTTLNVQSIQEYIDLMYRSNIIVHHINATDIIYTR